MCFPCAPDRIDADGDPSALRRPVEFFYQAQADQAFQSMVVNESVVTLQIFHFDMPHHPLPHFNPVLTDSKHLLLQAVPVSASGLCGLCGEAPAFPDDKRFEVIKLPYDLV
jgi:hypothetical protein